MAEAGTPVEHVSENADADRPSAAAEHLDVLIAGAGLSGIGAGYHLQARCPGLSYAILEARSASGGT